VIAIEIVPPPNVAPSIELLRRYVADSRNILRRMTPCEAEAQRVVRAYNARPKHDGTITYLARGL
jgi:hypothetical protein